MEKLSALLRQTRMQKGLSLSDIKKLSDDTISDAYISKIEKGFRPSPKKLRVIADIYKLDFLELMVLAGHVLKSDLKSKRGAA